MILINCKIFFNYLLQRVIRVFNLDNRLRKNRKRKVDFSTSFKNKEIAIFHVGLAAVKANSAKEAYDLIIEAASDLSNYALPGFTPSFRSSGVYSYSHSRPEVGRFSVLAKGSCFYRTTDPIHSFFLKERVLCDELDMSDTFIENGFFSLFTKEDSCWVNIGTKSLVSTVFHHIERVANVPYLEHVKHFGVMYKDGEVVEIEHYSYKYNRRVAWNKIKIEKTLSKAGAILQQGYWNGAYCQVIDGHLAAKVLLNKLKDDPYYLVT